MNNVENLIMDKYKLPKNSFIKGWFINPQICDDLINTYKNLPSTVKDQGVTYKLSTNELVTNKEVKDSTDYSFYPHTGISPFYEYELALQKCLEDYTKTYSMVNYLPKFRIVEKVNIQYYKPKGGFKPWHFERNNESCLRRSFVFMTYLNNVPDGGTEFLYQKITTPAKKGLTLIWPPDWTHTHKGQISNEHEKYIVTGWYSLV